MVIRIALLVWSILVTLIAASVPAQPKDCTMQEAKLRQSVESLVVLASGAFDPEALKAKLLETERLAAQVRECKAETAKFSSSSSRADVDHQVGRPSPLELTERLNRTHRKPTAEAVSDLTRIENLLISARLAFSGGNIDREMLNKAIAGFRLR
jgi:hypothetical protein